MTFLIGNEEACLSEKSMGTCLYVSPVINDKALFLMDVRCVFMAVAAVVEENLNEFHASIQSYMYPLFFVVFNQQTEE